ncbi:MAG: LysE family transporter [Patescibacteria group bacterium]
MITKMFESILIGVSIAAIPGPIFFELVRRTLTKGFREGVLLVLGEFSGNFIILLAIFFGLSQFFTNHTVKILFYILGGLILLWVSYGALKLKQSSVELSYDEKPTLRGGSFFTGMIIAVTSPIVIALWISLSSSYLSSMSNHLLSFVNIFFIALGFLVFFIPLAYIVHKTRHRIAPPTVVQLSRAFGIVLIAYALILFYQATRIS